VPPYKGPSISTFIESFGKYDLLSYMKKYWPSRGEPSSHLWEHEFSKHATCFSNFDLPCYGPKYKKHEEVIEYFETTIAFYRQLPTYSWLHSSGIVPSNTTTYTLSSLQSALTKGFGALPYIGCSGPRFNETTAGNGTTDNGRTVVGEVWYYYHTLGRVQNTKGVPVNADVNGGSVSSCAKAKGALRYAERSVESEA
jgi:ribonuclease T2